MHRKCKCTTCIYIVSDRHVLCQMAPQRNALGMANYLPAVRESFTHKNLCFTKASKILPRENFPLYGRTSIAAGCTFPVHMVYSSVSVYWAFIRMHDTRALIVYLQPRQEDPEDADRASLPPHQPGDVQVWAPLPLQTRRTVQL